MAASSFYTNVINEVIESLKTQFNEEGIDPAVLNDLKEIWEKKIKDSGALEPIKHPVPSAAHFSSMMQPNDISRNNSVRLPSISNPSSRLIKPSGQGSVMPDQNYNAPRMTVPVLVQQGNNTYRPANSFMSNNFSQNNNSNNHHHHINDMYPPPPSNPYRMHPFQNCDYLFGQWLKNDRLRNVDKSKQPPINNNNNNYRNETVPMVINTNPQHGIPMFSQYHNIINPNQIITDNNVVNLRKNQVDGNDEGSSDDEENDFVNVSEVDPQSVRPPMSNIPTPVVFKKETKEEETDEELVEDDIENLNHHDLAVKHEQTDEEDNEDDDDEVEEPQNEEDPLNSEDDISDDDPEKIFETDNVIVCQYEKVNRTRNKWKLNFVSGIANLQGKDSVFHKAVGEAEW